MDEKTNKNLTYLLKKLVNGDISALGIIYIKLGKGLIHFAKIFLGNKSDAEDVLHDFMLALTDKAKRLKNDSNVYSWITKCFENMIKDKIRKRNNLMEVSLDNAMNIAEVQNENRLFIKEALEDMSENDRHIIYCKYWHKLSLSEIAILLKTPKSTIEYRLTRARKEVKTFLEKS